MSKFTYTVGPGLFRSLRQAKQPGKGTLDKVLPVMTFTLAVLGTVFGLFQYSQNNKAARVNRVLELHRTYVGTSGGSVRPLFEFWEQYTSDWRHAVVSVKCDYLNELERDDISSKFDCKDPTVGDLLGKVELSEAEGEILRNRIDTYTLKSLSEPEVSANLKRVLYTFRQVIICVEQSACDRLAAVQFFGSDMLSFVNGACPLFKKEGQAWKTPAPDTIIAQFLTDNFDELKVPRPKPGRNLFWCTDHRSIWLHSNSYNSI